MTTDFDTADSNTTAEVPPATAGSSAIRNRRLWRLGTVLVAALLASAVWAVAVPIARLELVVGVAGAVQHIGLGRVAITALGLGFGAWLLLALLEKLGRRGRRIWQVTGWAVLALSLVAPLPMGPAPAVLLTLLTMHLVVGVALIRGLARRPRDA